MSGFDVYTLRVEVSHSVHLYSQRENLLGLTETDQTGIQTAVRHNLPPSQQITALYLVPYELLLQPKWELIGD